MEGLEKLNNLLSTKETRVYSISGKITNNDGTYVCQMSDEQKFKQGVTHDVYLKSFTGWSYFPNVSLKNNKFYFSELRNPKDIKDGKWIEKEITFPEGAYNIDDYNIFLAEELKKMVLKNHLLSSLFIGIQENASWK
jgi:hypothetical protein